MSLSRRQFIPSAASAPFLLRSLLGQAERPNVLLVIADDLAAWMCGCYGNREIKTPHIDLLARTGVRFTSNFVVTPVCSASRATLFTGRLPRQHGIHDFLTDNPVENPPQGQKDVPESFRNEVMISGLLARASYDCGFIGKWHMGNDAQPQHGFRYWHTMMGSRSYRDPELSRNGKVERASGYLADLLTASALEFLDTQKKGQPFFLTVSHLNPHVPYEGHPEKYYEMYAKTAFESVGWLPKAPNALREKEYMDDPVANIRRCAAATTALDDQIPPLLKKLEEKGLRDNTLIIFTGDNGFLLGRHGLWSKGLASDPINMYEEVMQVPMIWNWRGRLPVQAVRPEMVDFADFLPSLCEALGLEAPAGRGLTGRSYWPLAMNLPLPKGRPWRNQVFGHFRNTEMVREPRFKLILRNNGPGPNEFYDLSKDPREMVNEMANPQYDSVIVRLRQEIERWRSNTAS